MNEFKLGDKVRSTVSGFEGTVIGKAKFLHGTPQVMVIAPKPIEGKIKKYWIAESELEVIE